MQSDSIRLESLLILWSGNGIDNGSVDPPDCSESLSSAPSNIKLLLTNGTDRHLWIVQDQPLQQFLCKFPLSRCLESSNPFNYRSLNPPSNSESASSAQPKIKDTVPKRHRRNPQDRSRPDFAFIPLALPTFSLLNRSPSHPPDHCKSVC